MIIMIMTKWNEHSPADLTAHNWQIFRRTQSAQKTLKTHKTMNLEKPDDINAFFNEP